VDIDVLEIGARMTRDSTAPGTGAEAVGIAQGVGQAGARKPDPCTPLPGLDLVGCDAGGRGPAHARPSTPVSPFRRCSTRIWGERMEPLTNETVELLQVREPRYGRIR